MTIDVTSVFPVNAQGELVFQAGTGDTTVVGYVSEGSIPTDTSTNRVVAVGMGGTPAAIAPIQIAGSRTLTSADNGATLYSTSSSAYTLTLATGLPTNFGVAIVQAGSGQITVAAGAGTTVANVSTQFKTSAINAVIAVIQTTANAYYVSGSTGA